MPGISEWRAVLHALDDEQIVNLLRAPLRTTNEGVMILRALRLNAIGEHERNSLRAEVRMQRFRVASG